MAKRNEQAERMRDHLAQLCSVGDNATGLDFGGWPTRLAAVSAALGFAAALGACYGGPPPEAMMPPEVPQSPATTDSAPEDTASGAPQAAPEAAAAPTDG